MMHIRDLYYTVVLAVGAWFEWMDAKYWAKDIRPAWLQMATKCKNKSTRQYYKRKILAAYRGEEDG